MAQNHRGAPRGTAGNRRQIEREVIGNREAVEMREQVAAIGQATLGLGTHQQFDRGGPPRKGRIEIALAIGDDADRRGAGRAQACGRGGAHQPTAGLFLVRRAPCVLCRRTVSFPQLHIEQPQNDAAVGIDHQHRMNEEGRIGAVPAATDRGFATLMLREVDLARVVYRQHATTGNLRQYMRPRCRDQRRLAHVIIAQKSPDRLFARFVTAEPFDRYRPALHHAFEQPPPLFCSRSSPKIPRSSATTIAAPIHKTATHRIIDLTATPHVPFIPSQHVALFVTTEMCPPRRGRGGGERRRRSAHGNGSPPPHPSPQAGEGVNPQPPKGPNQQICPRRRRRRNARRTRPCRRSGAAAAGGGAGELRGPCRRCHRALPGRPQRRTTSGPRSPACADDGPGTAIGHFRR